MNLEPCLEELNPSQQISNNSLPSSAPKLDLWAENEELDLTDIKNHKFFQIGGIFVASPEFPAPAAGRIVNFLKCINEVIENKQICHWYYCSAQEATHILGIGIIKKGGYSRLFNIEDINLTGMVDWDVEVLEHTRMNARLNEGREAHFYHQR